MGSVVSPTAAPTYGPIGGYSVVDVPDGTFPNQAMVIDRYVNASGNTVPITTKNVLQFWNAESGSTVINHSAVGFKGGAFPAKPHTFPTPLAIATGTAVTNASTWSTGRISPSSYAQCFSRTFTLSAGTYYFGDLDYYNVGTFQNVIVVATPGPLQRGTLRLTQSKRRFTPR